MANTELFREKYNLTQKDIADRFEIPIRTVENWDYRNSMPQYVWNMLNCYFCSFSYDAEQIVRANHGGAFEVFGELDYNCDEFLEAMHKLIISDIEDILWERSKFPFSLPERS